jgi:hypothetical protein
MTMSKSNRVLPAGLFGVWCALMASACSTYERVRYERPWIDNALLGAAVLLALVPAHAVGLAAFGYAKRRDYPGIICRRYQLIAAGVCLFVLLSGIAYVRFGLGR